MTTRTQISLLTDADRHNLIIFGTSIYAILLVLFWVFYPIWFIAVPVSIFVTIAGAYCEIAGRHKPIEIIEIAVPQEPANPAKPKRVPNPDRWIRGPKGGLYKVVNGRKVYKKKDPKRVAAGKKAAATRKRNQLAKAREELRAQILKGHLRVVGE